MVLRSMLLTSYEPWVDLLLVFEGSNGLQRGDGRGVDSDRVHGLERLVLHHPNLPLMVEEVVVRNHGEQTAIHGGLGRGVVVIGRVGEGGAGGWAVVEGHLVLVQIAAGGIGGQWRAVHLLHV